jgi:t-SNARE complex subunit (syntaxin)
MGELVGGEQRDLVDQLGANANLTQENLIHANDELDQAIVYQKKSKKKFFFLVTCIIIVVLVAAGIIYLFIK